MAEGNGSMHMTDIEVKMKRFVLSLSYRHQHEKHRIPIDMHTRAHMYAYTYNTQHTLNDNHPKRLCKLCNQCRVECINVCDTKQHNRMYTFNIWGLEMKIK